MGSIDRKKQRAKISCYCPFKQKTPKRKVRADSKSMADKVIPSASKLNRKPNTVVEKLTDEVDLLEARTLDLEKRIRAAEDPTNCMKATKYSNPSELICSSPPKGRKEVQGWGVHLQGQPNHALFCILGLAVAPLSRVAIEISFRKHSAE